MAIALVFGVWLGIGVLLPPQPASAAAQTFEIKPGEGFREIISELGRTGLIRSSLAAEWYFLLRGSANKLKPGLYELFPSMSAENIRSILVEGQNREVLVTIPEGSTLYEIDGLLASSGALPKGTLVAYAAATSSEIEGKLFPDTYKFFYASTPAEAVQKFTENFNAKLILLLPQDTVRRRDALILASILEKEVPGSYDRQIVAGILTKRLKAGMPLQVDASICYSKEKLAGTDLSCYPLSPLDFKIDSLYNTYTHKGLPPGPIGNPGTDAVAAALHPIETEYWFYLSDPGTHKTIFSKTLDTHDQNRVKYLKK